MDSQGLIEHGATDLNFKLHLMLERGPKLLGCLGVAPTNNVTSIAGNGQDVFLLIHLSDQFQIELSPQEPEGMELGL